jgi:rare lipoprotein A
MAVASALFIQSKLSASYHATYPPFDFPNIFSGKASWYSKESPGINEFTANNEHFDDTDLTCAMWGVPFNQQIKVTNKANGKSVVVRVNDRGPHYRFVQKGRIIDLTKEAFSRIAQPKSGLIDIELEFL